MSTHGGGGGHVNTRGVEGMSTHAHTHTHTHTHRAAYMFSLTFWNFTRLTEIAFIAHNHHGDTRQARLYKGLYTCTHAQGTYIVDGLYPLEKCLKAL